MSQALDMSIGILIHGDAGVGNQINTFGGLDTRILSFISNLQDDRQSNMFDPLIVNPGGFVSNFSYLPLSNDWDPIDLTAKIMGVKNTQYDALNTLNFKMKGFNGTSYESYIVQGSPSNFNPNTGNILTNVSIEAIW
jgi:hypothetical protein